MGWVWGLGSGGKLDQPADWAVCGQAKAEAHEQGLGEDEDGRRKDH